MLWRGFFTREATEHCAPSQQPRDGERLFDSAGRRHYNIRSDPNRALRDEYTQLPLHRPCSSSLQRALSFGLRQCVLARSTFGSLDSRVQLCKGRYLLARAGRPKNNSLTSWIPHSATSCREIFSFAGSCACISSPVAIPTHFLDLPKRNAEENRCSPAAKIRGIAYHKEFSNQCGGE